jgi:hypothetical protein
MAPMKSTCRPLRRSESRVTTPFSTPRANNAKPVERRDSAIATFRLTKKYGHSGTTAATA